MKKFKVKIIVQRGSESGEAFGERIERFCNKIDNLKKSPKITLTSDSLGRQTALIQYIVIEEKKSNFSN